ncbi:unnamed protein product, partial [marine sediment metagenome]
DNIEAISLREMVPNQLEVDHRFPQVRWSKDESYDPELNEDELHSKFQLLTRQHNLWKSRFSRGLKFFDRLSFPFCLFPPGLPIRTNKASISRKWSIFLIK